MGIYSKNKIEWIIAYLGSHSNSANVVTIYDTLGEKAMEYILGQTEFETILIEACCLSKNLKLKKRKKNKQIKKLNSSRLRRLASNNTIIKRTRNKYIYI